MPKGKYPRTDKQKEISRQLGLSRKGFNPYIHTEEINKKISKSLLGNIPVNKGIQRQDILKKVERFKNGLENECKYHGFHKKWNLHSENNVRCKICVSEYQKKSAKKDPFKFILRDAKQHAKKSNRKFEITYLDLKNLFEIQENKCALSGIEFNENIRPSLDRIDSMKGYEKDNIQLLAFEINRMKSNFEEKKFIELCEMVIETSKKKKK